MASGMGITLDEFVATLEGLKLMDYQDNLAFFGTEGKAGPAVRCAPECSQFLLRPKDHSS